MDEQVFPWIDDDVAIEIIGKMIAEQVSLLNEHIEPLLEAGFYPDDAVIKNDSIYVECMQRIIEYKQEINQIYRGENSERVHRKVNEQYAPYLKDKYIRKISFA